MANTLQELHKKIRFHHCHCWVPGSNVDAEVQDIFNDGLAEYYQGNSEETDPQNESVELEIEDLEAI